MKTIAQLIAEHPFFRGIDRADLDLLADCGMNVHFGRGDRILSEGAPASRFYLLRTGTVALGFRTIGCGEVIVETLRGGEVLGWSWLVAPYTWQFDADAIEPVSAVVFDAECLRVRCDSDPRLGYALSQRFTQVMLQRLQSARLRLCDVYGPVSRRSPRSGVLV